MLSRIEPVPSEEIDGRSGLLEEIPKISEIIHSAYELQD